ncbi:L-threonine 3-dehydrogenase-like [Oratosquilla oratoria]|uniref:L-threonine 3-dehydrogenase-like n=1 Tax=Oratosquilla oratoria TaxID=337810 RepID=UPI003F771C16
MATKTMRCLLKTKESEGYDLIEREMPKPGRGDVIIRVAKVAICGSDINLWKWNDLARTIAALPFIPGHEAVGEVVEVGEDVTHLKKGQHVAVENHFFCSECFQCKNGRGDICQRMSQYGHGKGTDQGGCAQYSCLKAQYCYALKHPLTSNQAVLLEPMGVAHNAVEHIDVVGEDVLVLGCGPVGLLAIAVAKALGAAKVYGVDIVADQLDLAKRMGADLVINSSKESLDARIMELTSNNGVGRIVEASGVASVLNGSFKLLRKGGHMVLIGLPKAPLHVENVLTDVVFKSLTLKTVHGRRIWSTWEECERLLAEGKVDVNPIISHDLPMSNFHEAFQALLSGKACKIILDPQL